MREIVFTVLGRPVGKGRPRVTRYGTYTPQKTKDYEALVQRCWRTQSGVAFGGGIALKASITAWFPLPKNTSKKKRALLEGTFHLAKPDADNLVKAILDAGNGLFYPDDSAVQLAGCEKRWTGGAPRVEVRIWEAEP